QVSRVLELPQLAEHHGVAEVDVRCGRVDPELHPQLPPLLARSLQALGESPPREAVDGVAAEPPGLLQGRLTGVWHVGPMLDSRAIGRALRRAAPPRRRPPDPTRPPAAPAPSAPLDERRPESRHTAVDRAQAAGETA